MHSSHVVRDINVRQSGFAVVPEVDLGVFKRDVTCDHKVYTFVYFDVWLQFDTRLFAPRMLACPTPSLPYYAMRSGREQAQRNAFKRIAMRCNALQEQWRDQWIAQWVANALQCIASMTMSQVREVVIRYGLVQSRIDLELRMRV